MIEINLVVFKKNNSSSLENLFSSLHEKIVFIFPPLFGKNKLE